MPTVRDQIAAYLASQPEPKHTEMLALHRLITKAMPRCKLWFLDGKDASGKTVSNPNIGYGKHTIRYANGETKDFYRVGLSANSAGISVYIMGAPDKTYLSRTYGRKLGKATVTGYCIRFKALKDIDPAVLTTAIRDAAAFA